MTMVDHDAAPAEPGRRPTLEDVARYARVSRQTVSRVVNGSGPVAATTRARVEAGMALLRFTPDPVAQQLGRYRRPERRPAPRLTPGCLEALATLRSAGLVVHVRLGGPAPDVVAIAPHTPLTTDPP